MIKASCRNENLLSFLVSSKKVFLKVYNYPQVITIFFPVNANWELEIPLIKRYYCEYIMSIFLVWKEN